MSGPTPTDTQGHERSPKIDNAIVLYIFSLNADMELETEDNMDITPALVTLRRSSQVCSTWRKVAIGSPSLWARTLNLNFLSQRDNRWMKEVLRRTGTTLLHVKSVDYGYNKWPLAVASVQWLLTEHWKRICSLDLQLSSEFDPDEEQWRHIFQRPARSLEVFRFSWSSGSECFEDSDFSLFSDRAPSLRTLDMVDIPVPLTFLSAPNLQNLVLHSTVSASALLSALNEMTLIKTLETRSAFPFLRHENTPPSIPQVITLPRLTTVKFQPVHHPLNISLAFLARIIPANGCALEFFGVHSLESSDQNSKNLYGTILLRYSQSCTELQNATNLKTTLFQDSFKFSVNLSSDRQFCFSIKNNGTFLDGTISTVLSSFKGMRLETVSRLTLHLQFADPVRLNPDVAKFVLTLRSVEDLETDGATLNVLRNIQRHGKTKVIIFPALKIIRLDHVVQPDQVLPISDFIKTRVRMGIPADTLTLKMWGLLAENQAKMLRSLVPGLTVQITAEFGEE